MRSGFGARNYLEKEDTTPLLYGTLPNPASKPGISRTNTDSNGKPKQSVSSMVAAQLLSGSSLSSLVTQYPGYALQNLQKMKQFASFSSVMRANSSKSKWPGPLEYRRGCSVTRALAEWCSLNIQCKRSFKQKQLFLHGPPNTLKTSFLHILTPYCTTYEVPPAEDFFDHYSDPEPDLCYIDEFKAGKITLHQWCLFLQGGLGTTLKQKFGSTIKKTNPPFIFISNYSPHQCWSAALAKDPTVLDPFLARVLVVEVTEPLDLQGFEEALVRATLATTLSALAPPSAAPAAISELDLTNLLG